MATYDFEDFVFSADSRRDPEDLAEVFLSKAKHGGVVRIGTKYYNVQNLTYGYNSGQRLRISNPDSNEMKYISTEDGVLICSNEILSASVEILSSCPSCYAADIEAISETELCCESCGILD